MEVNVYRARKFLSGLKGLREGRETTEDDPRPGRPSTSKTDDNIQKIGPRRSDSQSTLSRRGSDCPTWTNEETKTRSVEEQVVDATPRQCASPVRLVCEDVLCEIRHDRVEPPHRTPPTWPPVNFFLFPKVKSEIEGTRFDSVDSVEAAKAKATEVLNKLTKRTSKHCFEQWKIRMARCRDRQGEYIESDRLSNVTGDQWNVL